MALDLVSSWEWSQDKPKRVDFASRILGVVFIPKCQRKTIYGQIRRELVGVFRDCRIIVRLAKLTLGCQITVKAVRMNVFMTDPPMVSQPGQPHQRLRRWLLGILLIYPIWLLLLGPFWALDGRGTMDFLPFSVRRIVYLPAAPFYCIPGLHSFFDRYMNWWYEDPNAPETTL